MNRNPLKQHLIEGPVTYDITLHSRVGDHTTWSWRCIGTTFGHFHLGSHYFMVTTLGSCVKWPLGPTQTSARIRREQQHTRPILFVPPSVSTLSSSYVCYSIHQMQLQTCQQPLSNKHNHSSTREVWSHPKGNTQNVIFFIDVATLVGDMAVWRSRQTLARRKALSESYTMHAISC